MNHKKILALLLTVATLVPSALYAHNTNDITTTGSENHIGVRVTTDQSGQIKTITNPEKIKEILIEKGIYDPTENVVAVIETTLSPVSEQSTNEHNDKESKLIVREIYTRLVSEESGTESKYSYNQNYPAGDFDFEQQITSGWQLTNNLGIKTEVFENVLGYTLNSSTTEAWIYHSDPYSYPFNVKAYKNYDKEIYDVYDLDLMFDDYIGRTAVKRETGYTLKVTPL